MNVAIIDYGAGNLTSLKAAFQAVGADAEITRDPTALHSAQRIVVPGVGHFSATTQLHDSGMTDAIRQRADRGTPLLGICLGMQWLFEGSDEAPAALGLGRFPGTSRRFSATVKCPHVGWNQLQQLSPRSRLLAGIHEGTFAYFTHSYCIPSASDTVATCEYAGHFAAVVEHENVFGVQFHPEKSARVGLQILQNFCALPC